MWLQTGEPAPRRRRREQGEDGPHNSAMLSLDARLRNLEGRAPAWFLNETESVLVPAMQAAHQTYDSRHPGKGKAHPDGHRRTTLAGALLLKLAERDLSKAGAAEQSELARRNRILELAKMPNISMQQEILKLLIKEYQTPQLMQPEIQECSWFKAKKGGKFVLVLALQPHSPLHQTLGFVHFCLEALGAGPTFGSPPRSGVMRGLA